MFGSKKNAKYLDYQQLNKENQTILAFDILTHHWNVWMQMDMGSLLSNMRRKWSLQQILWNSSNGQALHSQIPWLSPVTRASHKWMASAHSLSPHRGFSLLSLILSLLIFLWCVHCWDFLWLCISGMGFWFSIQHGFGNEVVFVVAICWRKLGFGID